MHTQIMDNINKKNNDLTLFLNSEDDGVFYTGHASILVRLNNKKYLFDFWIFYFCKIIYRLNLPSYI